MIDEDKLENFSASDLVKKSAKTICYFRKKKLARTVTPGMYKGNEAAERKTISEYREMRGSFVLPEKLIHYSFDEIQLNKDKTEATLIEHKNIEDDDIVEDWYVHYSILQLAFYQALMLENPSKQYFTAKFFRKQGYNTNFLDLSNKQINAILHIGEDKYKVMSLDPKAIVTFYTKKLDSIFEYDTAIEWDEKWKRREWEYLKKYIGYTKIK